MCLSTVFFSRGTVLSVETHWVQLQVRFLEGIATPSEDFSFKTYPGISN
jgi:hypothetical protein